MKRSGVTLLEVLFAIGIVSVGILGVTSLGPIMPGPPPFPVPGSNALMRDPGDEYRGGRRYVYYPFDCWEDHDLNSATPPVITVPADSWSEVPSKYHSKF